MLLKLTNILLIVIYLLSGTVLSGYGKISIKTYDVISNKTNSPRQQFLSNQRQQKHIFSNPEYSAFADAEACSKHTEDIVLEPFIILPRLNAELPESGFISAVKNKAPPLI